MNYEWIGKTISKKSYPENGKNQDQNASCEQT